MTKEQILIRRIKEHEDKALREVYKANRQAFVDFSARFGLDKEDVLDIYQDAMVVFCENARKGKLDTLQSSISTYIFAVGKYMIYARLKKNGRQVSMEELPEDPDRFVMQSDGLEDPDERILAIRQAFQGLGSKCSEVLRLFYYEEKKLDEIQEIMGYDSKDVLKSHKSRCLKQLKELLLSKKSHG